MDGKSLFLRTGFQLSARIPLPTSLRSATFPPGEGITQTNGNLQKQWLSKYRVILSERSESKNPYSKENGFLVTAFLGMTGVIR